MIRRYLVLIFLSLSTLNIGCSTLMSSPEPRHMWPSIQHTSCTSSKVAPTLDSIGGGVLIGWGIVGVAFGNPASLLDVLIGSLLTWSSSKGSEDADSCFALKNYLATEGTRQSDEGKERESADMEGKRLEIEKMKLEIEREKIELEKMKQQMNKDRK